MTDFNEVELAEATKKEPKKRQHLCPSCQNDPHTCLPKPITPAMGEIKSEKNPDGFTVSMCYFHSKIPPKVVRTEDTFTVESDGQSWEASVDDVQEMNRKIRSKDPEINVTLKDTKTDAHQIAVTLMEHGMLPTQAIPMTAERKQELAEKEEKEAEAKEKTTAEVKQPDIGMPKDFSF
jgi:hypothetical protein